MKLYIKIDLGNGFEEIEFSSDELYTKCSKCGQLLGLSQVLAQYEGVICDDCSYVPPKEPRKEETVALIMAIFESRGKLITKKRAENIYERYMKPRLDAEDESKHALAENVTIISANGYRDVVKKLDFAVS